MYNNLENIYNMIEKIRDNILVYDLNEVFINVDSLIQEISNSTSLESMPEEKIKVFNTILENLMVAMKNQDYLLLADVLKYQLKDFIENI